MFENNLVSLKGQKILGHTVVGLLLGFNSKFVMSIPPFHMRCPPCLGENLSQLFFVTLIVKPLCYFYFNHKNGKKVKLALYWQYHFMGSY